MRWHGPRWSPRPMGFRGAVLALQRNGEAMNTHRIESEPSVRFLPFRCYLLDRHVIGEKPDGTMKCERCGEDLIWRLKQFQWPARMRTRGRRQKAVIHRV